VGRLLPLKQARPGSRVITRSARASGREIQTIGRHTMGDVKSEMTPSKGNDVEDLRGIGDKVKDGLKGLVGKRKDKDGDPQAASKNFADHIIAADTKLTEMLAMKRADLSREPGDQAYNRKALAHLETMEYHLGEIANLAEQYGKLRST
jgi:hypothetical protein